MKTLTLALSLLCSSLLLITNNCNAQGLASGKQENDRYAQGTIMVTGKKTSFPEKVDLSPYCPTPQYQGYIPSCVGYACSYAQTIQNAIKNDWKDRQAITNSLLSPLYLYNQNRNRKIKGCRGFTSLSKTLDFLTTAGNLRYEEFDKQYESACQYRVDNSLKKKALDNKISNYRTIFGKTATSKIKLKNMKVSLSDSLSVIVGLDNFRFSEESDSKTGKHAVTVIAYDDDKQEFKYINSYGTKWGEDGFGTISYEHFLEDVMYAYQIHIKDGNKEPMAFTGSFRFMYERPNSSFMNQASVQLKKNRYLLRKAREVYDTGWQIGQGFQLLAKNDLDGEYIYVFSVNSNNKVEVHYPLANTPPPSDLIDQEITIPSKEKVLVLEETGKDYVCILFCRQPLTGFESVVNDISGMDGSLQSRLENYFGSYLIPEKNIQYSPQSMAFMARLVPKSHSFIVPLILEIDVN